jgi:hypothetical protein
VIRNWHNEDSMTRKCFWCGILVVALTVGLATPARANNAETVLIVVVAATAAAAIAVFVTVASVQHRYRKIVITGCVISTEKGMTITDEQDRKLYELSGDTTGVKSGDRVRLLGKKVKPKGSDKTRVWEAREVLKEIARFGHCRCLIRFRLKNGGCLWKSA